MKPEPLISDLAMVVRQLERGDVILSESQLYRINLLFLAGQKAAGKLLVENDA